MSVEVVVGFFVIAVVENVTVAEGAESESAVESMKTRAKPGAGTLTEHVPADWSQAAVSIVSVPCNRPSI